MSEQPFDYATLRSGGKSNRVKETLGFFSSFFICGTMVVVSSFLLRMGVNATIPAFSTTHLNKVIQEEKQIYDLSNFRFEWANLAHAILGVQTVHAAGYEAMLVGQPETLTLKPGENGVTRVSFKNVGHLRWRTPETGTKYASIYTYDPKYHLSRLESKEWRRRDQPAVIESQTEPNETGYITIPVTAPFESGIYKETFQLAIEDTAWVSGGKFSVSVEVVDEEVEIEVPTVVQHVPSPSRAKSPVGATPLYGGEGQGEGDLDTTPHPDPDRGQRQLGPSSPFMGSTPQGEREQAEPHKALLLVRSHRRVLAAGGEDILMRFGFKNIGETTWLNRGLSTGQIALATVVQGASFAHKSWLSSNEPIKIAAGTVAPGQTEFFTFYIKTPEQIGEYNLKLNLFVDERFVDGGEISVPVEVTTNVSVSSAEPVSFEGEVELLDEPRIRVGLFKTEDPIEFKSPFDYVVKDVNGNIVQELLKDTLAIIHYKNGQYIFYAKGTTLNSNTHWRLEPKSPSPLPSPLKGEGNDGAYFEIVNHEERPNWNPGLNYNQFRDTFELRYSEENDKVWAINELTMEPYIAGLAEVSNDTPEEFRKAMAVAERTYAYYHLKDGTKHADRNFDVNASWGDQVYRGYAREKRFDMVVEGVEATRGEMVVYNKDVIVTPYFARSDGRTRSWKEVWGGKDKPWLVSVKTNYDIGKSLWGHGVGMSQRDATHRAEKEGVDYKELLKYYYRGTELQKIYK